MLLPLHVSLYCAFAHAQMWNEKTAATTRVNYEVPNQFYSHKSPTSCSYEVSHVTTANIVLTRRYVIVIVLDELIDYRSLSPDV